MAKYETIRTKKPIITCEGICNWPHVWKPEPPSKYNNNRERYKLELLASKEDFAELIKACNWVAKEAFGKKISEIANPFRKGNDIIETGDGVNEVYRDKWVITPWSNKRPGVSSPSAQGLAKVTESDDLFWSGQIVRCSVMPYSYEDGGVALGLNNILVVGGGNRLAGGGTDPEEDFADFASKGEEEEEDSSFDDDDIPF